MNGSVKYAQIFDTFTNSEPLEHCIENVFMPNSIIIAACKDDCFTKMSDKVKDWFTIMGSIEIHKL